MYGKLNKIYGEDYKKIKVKVNNITLPDIILSDTNSLIFDFSTNNDLLGNFKLSTYNKDWLLFTK